MALSLGRFATALDDATARDEDDEDDEDDDIDDNIEGAIDVLVCSRVFRVRQTHTSETRKSFPCYIQYVYSSLQKLIPDSLVLPSKSSLSEVKMVPELHN